MFISRREKEQDNKIAALETEIAHLKADIELLQKVVIKEVEKSKRILNE